MAIPRAIIKQLVSEVPLVDQRSYSGPVPAGGAILSDVFNLTLSGFLNPFGLGDPAAATRIAPGHFCYVFLFYQPAGASITVSFLANAFPGGTLRVLASPASVAPILVPANTPFVYRTDTLGAVWDCQIALSNAGASGTTALDFAVGFRAR